MAKRYHQSKKDRRHESAGMERYEREGSSMPNKHPQKYNDERDHDQDSYPRDMYRRPMSSAELYAGMEPRRRQELEDSGMIHEDHRAIANLPQEVMFKTYPRTGPYLPEMLNDDISGVDAQMDYDDSQRRRHFYPKKV